MNVVCLMGRLTKDPETRYSQSGMCVCNYSMAVDRRVKKDGENSTDFFDIVAFGKAGEFAGKWFRRGMRITVQGRLTQDTYKSRDGGTRTKYQIVAEQQFFADTKREDTGVKETEEGPKEDFMDIPEGNLDELPFN